ncbi:MAG: 4Fe-4S binding protein [Bacteroidales bacterium]|nr:4Fe-4S binding protein [Bacteroidales bacterium]
MKKIFDNKWLIKSLRVLIIIAIMFIIGYRQGKFFGYTFGQSNEPQTTQRSNLTLTQVQAMFGNARSYAQDNLGHTAVYDINNALLGIVISSKPYSDSLSGFAGPVHFLIGINKENKIAGIVLTEHNESPGYLSFIESEGFFEKLKGKSINEIINQRIDAVSGASMTCNAVSTALQKRLAAHLEVILKAKSEDSKKKIGNAFSLLIILFALLCFFTKKLRKYRIALLIGSIAILGFYQGTFISLFLLQGWTLSGVPIISQWVIGGIVIISILLPLFLNKSFYCNYLCPFGAAQELIGKINKNKKPVPFQKTLVLKYLREGIFYTLIVLVISGLNIDLTNVEPFSAFVFQSASIVAIILALVFLILSVFFNKPWCYYFCPTGQFLAFFRVQKDNK